MRGFAVENADDTIDDRTAGRGGGDARGTGESRGARDNGGVPGGLGLCGSGDRHRWRVTTNLRPSSWRRSTRAPPSLQRVRTGAIRGEGQARIASPGRDVTGASSSEKPAAARREAVQRPRPVCARKLPFSGDRFLAALEATYERAAGMPGICAGIEGLPTRLATCGALSVDGFPEPPRFLPGDTRGHRGLARVSCTPRGT